MSVGRLGVFAFKQTHTDCELQQKCAKFSLTSTWSTSPQVHKLCQNDRQGCMFSVTLNEKVINSKDIRIRPAIFQSSGHFPGIPWWSWMYFNSIQASAHGCLHCSSQQWQRLWWRGTSRAKCLPQLRDLEHVANVTSWRIVQPWYLGYLGYHVLGSNLEDLEVVAAILRPAKIQFAAPGLLEACEQLQHRPKCFNKFEKKLLGGLSAQP